MVYRQPQRLDGGPPQVSCHLVLAERVWLGETSPPQHVYPKCKCELQTLEKDGEDSGEQRQQGCYICQASCQT